MVLTHIDLKYVSLIYRKIRQKVPNGKGLISLRFADLEIKCPAVHRNHDENVETCKYEIKRLLNLIHFLKLWQNATIFLLVGKQKRQVYTGQNC